MLSVGFTSLIVLLYPLSLPLSSLCTVFTPISFKTANAFQSILLLMYFSSETLISIIGIG